MIPRASALDTRSLLKPLSCQAMASASDGETPLVAATCPICEALRCSGVGYGGSVTLPCAALPTGCELAAETVLGVPERWRVAPTRSGSLTLMPLLAARLSTLTPARAAMAESVSPGCTT